MITTLFTGEPLPDWPEFRKTATPLQIAQYRMELHLLGDEPDYPVLDRDWAKEQRFERCRRNLGNAREDVGRITS